MLCYVMLGCYVMLCYVTPCYVTLYCVVLCYVMLCCVVSGMLCGIVYAVGVCRLDRNHYRVESGVLNL